MSLKILGLSWNNLCIRSNRKW